MFSQQQFGGMPEARRSPREPWGKADWEVEHGMPAVAVHHDRLASVAKHGLKNQFETQTSNGAYNPGLRRQVEEEMFNVPTDRMGARRPVYGALTSTPEWVGHYGDVNAVVKPRKALNATVFRGDSLNRWSAGEDYQPVKLRDAVRGDEVPGPAAWDDPDYDPDDGWAGDAYVEPYHELQFRGRVRPQDIDHLSFQADTEDDYRSGEYHEQVRNLRDSGLPYRIHTSQRIEQPPLGTDESGLWVNGAVDWSRYRGNGPVNKVDFQDVTIEESPNLWSRSHYFQKGTPGEVLRATAKRQKR